MGDLISSGKLHWSLFTISLVGAQHYRGVDYVSRCKAAKLRHHSPKGCNRLPARHAIGVLAMPFIGLHIEADIVSTNRALTGFRFWELIRRWPGRRPTRRALVATEDRGSRLSLYCLVLYPPQMANGFRGLGVRLDRARQFGPALKLVNKVRNARSLDRTDGRLSVL